MLADYRTFPMAVLRPSSSWEVTADLPFATGVPDGHGHRYSAEYVDGWNAVLQPAGITSGELTQLRSIISEVR